MRRTNYGMYSYHKTSGSSIHPITAQLVGAASSLEHTCSIIPGGTGAEEAASIDGVSR